MAQGTAPKLTIESAVDLFILDARARRFTASTLRFYRGRLGLFQRWLADAGVLLLADIESSHIKRYFVSLQVAGGYFMHGAENVSGTRQQMTA